VARQCGAVTTGWWLVVQGQFYHFVSETLQNYAKNVNQENRRKKGATLQHGR
jgi:uncharacterized membrane protein